MSQIDIKSKHVKETFNYLKQQKLLVVAEEQLAKLCEKLSAVVVVAQLLGWVWQLLALPQLVPVMARQDQVRCQDC